MSSPYEPPQSASDSSGSTTAWVLGGLAIAAVIGVLGCGCLGGFAFLFLARTTPAPPPQIAPVEMPRERAPEPPPAEQEK